MSGSPDHRPLSPADLAAAEARAAEAEARASAAEAMISHLRLLIEKLRHDPKPFAWTADPDVILSKVRAIIGHLEPNKRSIH